MPLNVCRNNYTFDGAEHNFCDEWIENSLHENNIDFGSDTNPFFGDPTHGDYSIKAGADIMDNHYSQIGRY